MSDKPMAAVVAPLHEQVDPSSGRSLVFEPLKEYFDILPVAIGDNRCLPGSFALEELSIEQKVLVDLIITDGENGVEGEHMDIFPNAVAISNYGAGTNPIDVDGATKRELLVCNTPEVLNSATADLGISHIMALLHNSPRDNQWIREGKWVDARPPLHDDFMGKTIGIYGMGSIGTNLAAKMQHFVTSPIHYYNRNEVPADQLSSTFKHRAVYHSSLDALATASNILVCTAPLNDQSENSINAQILEKLGQDGYLVNIGRGEIHDEKAVLEALEKGTIRAAALDVHHDEYTEKKNLHSLMDSYKLIASPHVGSGTVGTRWQMGQLMLANSLALIETKGEAFVRSVNALTLGVDDTLGLSDFDVMSESLLDDVKDALSL